LNVRGHPSIPHSRAPPWPSTRHRNPSGIAGTAHAPRPQGNGGNSSVEPPRDCKASLTVARESRGTLHCPPPGPRPSPALLIREDRTILRWTRRSFVATGWPIVPASVRGCGLPWHRPITGPQADAGQHLAPSMRPRQPASSALQVPRNCVQAQSLSRISGIPCVACAPAHASPACA
jgi:hypothetical protein